ncbi:MAG: hypothetical protein LC745_07250 [Planctomycetia bacterium]|nr:hypothetical protein [Planctomycetia bacterium]
MGISEESRLYVLAVKANQPTLHTGIMDFFLDHMEDDFARVRVGRHETKEHGHGRDGHRTYLVSDVPDDLPDRGRWKGLKRIGGAISNFAIVRRMALSLLRNEKSQKVGVKTKRPTAGWNDDYLEQVLFGT